MNVERILIIGATSAIATAYARHAAANGASLVLAARDMQACSAIADDLLARGARAVAVEPFDAQNIKSHTAVVDNAWETLGGVDIALVAHGSLPDQSVTQTSPVDLSQHLQTNVVGSASIISEITNRLEAQSHGNLVVISSVAGDRGRQSNYIYGASKGFLNIFLEGIRHRLHNRSINVMCVKPGFVDTPMTQQFRKGPLWATPDRVAADIAKGIRRKSSVIYTPWYWRWIMLMIRLAPRRLIHATKL